MQFIICDCFFQPLLCSYFKFTVAIRELTLRWLKFSCFSVPSNYFFIGIVNVTLPSANYLCLCHSGPSLNSLILATAISKLEGLTTDRGNNTLGCLVFAFWSLNYYIYSLRALKIWTCLKAEVSYVSLPILIILTF